MPVTVDATRHRAIHPVHAVLLAGTLTLFLSALLNDLAYWSTYDVQWTNFASWLIAGGLVVSGIALLFALVGLRHAERRSGPSLLYFARLLVTWIVGFFNALVHAKDAWAAMPGGLVLSVIAAVLAGVATWLGFSSPRTGDLP
ncbi:MAG: DUF2231 domain-containing protein [Variovorax sp.]